jgi:two-component system, NarL family, nitrate/nitrite response regulator NarL
MTAGPLSGPPADRRRSVLVVDDNATMRYALRALLESEPELWDVVGEARDGNGAVRLAAELRPDVLVVDQQMPSMTGLEALPHLRRECPEARIVMWSSDPLSRAEAMRRGADAFIDKGDPLDRLVEALRSPDGR